MPQERTKVEIISHCKSAYWERKKCTYCGETKLLDEFYTDHEMRDGHTSRCKDCLREADRKRYAANPDKAKERNHKRYIAKKEKIKKYTLKWRAENQEKAKEINRRYNRKRRSTPKGKLNNSISAGIGKSLHGQKYGRHWEDLVGYTVDQLKRHIEKQFKDGMSWENYGSYWEIDHKIPITVFNFETPEDIDFKRCWALKNLQPLETITNIRKSNKLNKPFQPSLLISEICQL